MTKKECRKCGQLRECLNEKDICVFCSQGVGGKPKEVITQEIEDVAQNFKKKITKEVKQNE